MASTPSAAAPKTCKFPFEKCRNITPPGLTEFAVLTGYAPASSFIDIPESENVRKYLLEAEGKSRKKPSLIHRAIRDTLDNKGEQFPVLNSGIVIVAADVRIDEKLRVMNLSGTAETPVSIINGSQTKGELKRYLEKPPEDRSKREPLVRFEIIETQDEDLASEISISRNFQNQVEYLSILGKRNTLEGLERAVQIKIPGASLMKSETDSKDSSLLPTEKMLQVCFALLPDELFEGKASPKTSYGSKPSTYSSQAKWLKKFEELVKNSKSTSPDAELARRYQCILDTAADAWNLYNYWRQNQVYAKRFREMRKGEKKPAVSRKNGSPELMDGMVFPIIAAFSVFVTESAGRWTLDIPDAYKPGGILEEKLIETARNAYVLIADSNPQSMGKMLACYSSVSIVTTIYGVTKTIQDA